jgi:two-component system, LuxR family, response regulator FixJ
MIFIVDDDAGVRDSLRLLLESEGFAAREFASARQFLENARTDHRGCLLVDVQMPGMSGIELLEHLRRSGDTLPAIVISGHVDQVTRQRAHAAGAIAVIEKPYQSEELLDFIRRAFDGAGAA